MSNKTDYPDKPSLAATFEAFGDPRRESDHCPYGTFTHFGYEMACVLDTWSEFARQMEGVREYVEDLIDKARKAGHGVDAVRTLSYAGLLHYEPAHALIRQARAEAVGKDCMPNEPVTAEDVADICAFMWRWSLIK